MNQPEPTADAVATAEALAAKDAELLAELKARTAELGEKNDAGQEPFVIETDEAPRVPMNRAQRRQQVKLYAMLLAETERQTPIVNPTIIPKSKRRPKGRGNRRLNSARG